MRRILRIFSLVAPLSEPSIFYFGKAGTVEAFRETAEKLSVG